MNQISIWIFGYKNIEISSFVVLISPMSYIRKDLRKGHALKQVAEESLKAHASLC